MTEPASTSKDSSVIDAGAGIVLRAWRLSDAGRVTEIFRETRDLGRQVASEPRDDHASALLIHQEFTSGRDRWAWCIEVNGVAMGSVRIDVTTEDVEEEGSPGSQSGRGWVSYWSARELRGSGILSAAVRTVCDWALDTEGGALRRLELGYRANNPASARVAEKAGFVVEGRERQKFVVDGVPVDVLVAARLPSDPVPSGPRTHDVVVVPPEPRGPTPTVGIHHVELWTGSFAEHGASWDWLLHRLGWTVSQRWRGGVAWGSWEGLPYLVIEESSDVRGKLDRKNPGMNHLALRCRDRTELDSLRSEAAGHGWTEMFPESYPRAGGADHVALYLENAEGFEVEIVAGDS